MPSRTPFSFAGAARAAHPPALFPRECPTAAAVMGCA
ncbi:protein of unknown function [Cupriavidus taiwanensis]|nr:protein of unknown function [Cupriavidus taiwanensis]